MIDTAVGKKATKLHLKSNQKTLKPSMEFFAKISTTAEE